MKPAAQIALALGGAVGVYLVARAFKLQTPPPKSATPTSPCDKLASLGPSYVAACKLAGGLLGDAIKGRESGSEANAANIPLNGPQVSTVNIHPSFFTTGQGYLLQADARHVTPGFKAAEVPIYKNGCVPLSGHAGAAKCVAGTHMFNHFASPGSGQEYNPNTRQGDTLTHRHYTGLGVYKAFPVPCAAPSRPYWLSGQPVCVPEGAIFTRMHNPDGSVTVGYTMPPKPPKSTNGQPLPPPPKNPGAGQGGATTSPVTGPRCPTWPHC